MKGVSGIDKPLKMLPLNIFSKKTNYTHRQCLNMLKKREILGQIYKKQILVAPCKYSIHLFNAELIKEFWG